MESSEKILDKICSNIFECFKRSGKVLICGNGGSAAESDHFASELVGRFELEKRPLPAISLNSNGPILTSVSNDYSFDEVFTRQLSAFGELNDLLIVFSTSGRSQNIINVVDHAISKEIKTIAFLGRDGGDILNKVENALIVPSNSTARIQEVHLMMIHIICETIDQKFGAQAI